VTFPLPEPPDVVAFNAWEYGWLLLEVPREEIVSVDWFALPTVTVVVELVEVE
jgi:hypothetical protein